MRKHFLSFSVALVLLLAIGSLAQPPDTLWTNLYGGTVDDNAQCICQTFDGGFAIAGDTRSGPGLLGGYLVKVNAQGAQQWTQSYGGANYDYFKSIQQLPDSGYFLTGYSGSYGPSSRSVWALRIDANGDTLWMRIFGGPSSDVCYSGCMTSDGGFMLGCSCYSYGPGSTDLWLIKLNANGDSLWSRLYGSLGSDQIWGIKETADDGFIVTGTTNSYGTGSYDLHFFKTDSLGDSLWQTLCGAEYSTERGLSVIQTADGGYFAGGYSDDSAHVAGSNDFYAVKVSASGTVEWEGYYGGANYDYCNGVAQTADGTFLLVGYSNSFAAGNYDMYLVAVDGQGTQLWQMTFGGINNDYGYGITTTTDYGAALCGKTNSFGAGGYDAYLIRLAGITLEVTLTPWRPPVQVNPGGFFWYLGEVDNYTPDPITFDLWSEAILPNGVHFGPLLLYENLTIGGMGHRERAVRVNVPRFAPPGNYQYYAAVGDYPDIVIDDDQFPFTIAAGDPVSANNQWLAEPFDNITAPVPTEFSLGGASPNPFNPETTIGFTLPREGLVKLLVHNALGQQVAVLVDDMLSEGSYSVKWNAEGLNSGIYFITLNAGGWSGVEKCLLLK